MRSELVADKHPRTAAALQELQLAAKAEIKVRFKRRLQRRRGMRNKMYYLSRKVKKLESELESYKSAKSRQGRVSNEWMLRVFLAAPHTSGRALADSFHLVAGFDSTTVSRPSIRSIKAAWADMYIRMGKRMVRDIVKDHLRDCERARRPFVSVTFAHVQDEADIRLRSGDPRDRPKLPRRGRASKVQMHVVRIAVGHNRQEIPTELEALGTRAPAP